MGVPEKYLKMGGGGGGHNKIRIPNEGGSTKNYRTSLPSSFIKCGGGSEICSKLTNKSPERRQ